MQTIRTLQPIATNAGTLLKYDSMPAEKYRLLEWRSQSGFDKI